VLCAERLTSAGHANVDLLLLAANATAPGMNEASLPVRTEHTTHLPKY